LPVEEKPIHRYANLGLNGETDFVEFKAFWTTIGPPSHASYFFRVKHPSDKIVFFDPDGLEKWNASISNPFLHIANGDAISLGGDEDESILDYINRDIVRKRQILDDCIRGVPPFAIMQSCLKLAVETGVVTCEPLSDGWNYRLQFTQNLAVLAVEDYMAITGIFLPMMFSKSEIQLRHTKKCLICGRYYQAKGDKAVYCSERCRSRARFAAKR